MGRVPDKKRQPVGIVRSAAGPFNGASNTATRAPSGDSVTHALSSADNEISTRRTMRGYTRAEQRSGQPEFEWMGFRSLVPLRIPHGNLLRCAVARARATPARFEEQQP